MDYEFYETPAAFTRWLFDSVVIAGRIFEPCVGNGAIVSAVGPLRHWFTNDLDSRWSADCHKDARDGSLWQAHEFDWTVTNPPFSIALEIAEHAIAHSRVGVAMHLRASIHEVLKTGPRRTWLARQEPTGILWLPRVAYQRSKTTGQWTTDSVCACWVVWMRDKSVPQFIRYAPERVIDELDRETSAHRSRMDSLNGLIGSESSRQKQWVEMVKSTNLALVTR